MIREGTNLVSPDVGPVNNTILEEADKQPESKNITSDFESFTELDSSTDKESHNEQGYLSEFESQADELEQPSLVDEKTKSFEEENKENGSIKDFIDNENDMGNDKQDIQHMDDQKAEVTFAAVTADPVKKGYRSRKRSGGMSDLRRDATFVSSCPNKPLSTMSDIDKQNAAIHAIISQQQEDISEQTQRTKDIINAVRRNIRSTIQTRRQEQKNNRQSKHAALSRQNVKMANVNLNDSSGDMPDHQPPKMLLPSKRRVKRWRIKLPPLDQVGVVKKSGRNNIPKI